MLNLAKQDVAALGQSGVALDVTGQPTRGAVHADDEEDVDRDDEDVEAEGDQRRAGEVEAGWTDPALPRR